ncbi:hypothetical protein TPHA_0D00130 [Tetrapisispora phaffii CBS 4417]|uniref:Rho-GAP domain-containing protein n=1 Tax=Tetrapisispora phaffii (strain ATCC 24235 / CBS 4417 / NBRC 1672 / NRRL Y-8282 / UCD 70-5) TaxID=1071381 RepID=G8BS36_TETPH|nr:hypothetical protein TPHA_0D00130 [Tetrapisispora phaffii CBS 4417]CCE62657.1 hypothetical protein TPHA_0D00130 [Tetrapisispora phaffii CBS 4417]
MPSFAESFWSNDLNSGLAQLFDRLYHGCEQCDEFTQLFASRMQYEVAYGRQLFGVRNNVENINDFQDSSSTVESSLQKMIDATSNEGKNHLDIAANLEELVLKPFSKWCEDHRGRVKYSEDILKKNAKNFQKSRAYVAKLEKEYFNSCRKLETYRNTNFSEDQLRKAMSALKIQQKYDKHIEKEKDYQHFATIADINFDYKTMRETLKLFLTGLPKEEFKLPLISYSFPNTNNGSDITKFIIKYFSLKDSDHAETFAQELITLGFLKHCNGVGNNFVNSEKFQYQWKKDAYKFAKVPYPNEIDNIVRNNDEVTESLVSHYMDEITASTPDIEVSIRDKPELTNEESILFQLVKDVEDADTKYRQESYKMDNLRCSIEELMVDHLTFMEKCELDRLKAIKKVTFDFYSVFVNKITSIKLNVDRLMESEEAIDPTQDLLQLIKEHRTGYFQPKVITYNNFYNPGTTQNFGIDLETRSRLDKRVVPLIISAILLYMDNIYPDLDNDKVRISIWISPVKLNLTHELRAILNRKQFQDEGEIIELLKQSKYEPSTVASVLKIYLLELPNALIKNDITDVLKALYLDYSSPATSHDSIEDKSITEKLNEEVVTDKDDKDVILDNKDMKRIKGLSAILASLSKPRIATLAAIITHFHRLIQILKMGENGEHTALEFSNSISREFANCIIEVNIHDGNDLGFKIFYDLLQYKHEIINFLKEHNSKSKK